MTHTRVSTNDDVETISFVLASSWKTAYRGIVHDDYLDSLQDSRWVEFLRTGIDNGYVFSLVIENNQEIIGAAILCKTEKPNEANLISFYLLPEKIGQGLGHKFYVAIEAELRNRGFLNCTLDVLESNSRAIRFYEAHGFESTGNTVIATLGEKNYTCAVFEKTI